MSDGDVGNSRDSLDDATPDSFWEIGMYKRTVKRIEDGDRICDQMMKVCFFIYEKFLAFLSENRPENFIFSSDRNFVRKIRNFNWNGSELILRPENLIFLTLE